MFTYTCKYNKQPLNIMNHGIYERIIFPVF